MTHAPVIDIEGKKVGGDHPCFIIAELGINHNNDISIAKKMVDASVAAGCDAAKFQLIKADRMYPSSAGTVKWVTDKETQIYTIRDSNRKSELPLEWISEMMAYCEEKGIIFLSSVFDKEGADILEELGAQAYKIASPEISHLALIEHVAKKDKTIILSTGAATLEEVRTAYNLMRKHTKKIALLHCVMMYPTPLQDARMYRVEELRREFPEAVIGYSDHTSEPSAAPVAAVVLGAKIVEKHITLDREMKGPDQFFALEPSQLKQMVHDIRSTEKRMHSGEKIHIEKEVLGVAGTRPEREQYLRDFCYHKVFAFHDMKAGTLITADNVDLLRPGNVKVGLGPQEYEVLITGGFKAKHALKEGDPITWDNVTK